VRKILQLRAMLHRQIWKEAVPAIAGSLPTLRRNTPRTPYNTSMVKEFTATMTRVKLSLPFATRYPQTNTIAVFGKGFNTPVDK
jgi:hypothetical protein